MADLFAEFERETQQEERGGGGVRSRQPVGAGFNPFDEQDQISAHVPRLRPQLEFPIFKRCDTKLSIQSGITHLTASNGIATVVMVGNVIHRFNLETGRMVEHHDIKREESKVHRIFQDPSGQHLLCCLDSRECFYIGGKGGRRTQPRLLPKVKGHLIESVAWNRVEQSENGTGPILLGTSLGAIFETDIAFEETKLPQRRKGYFHQVYELLHDSLEHRDSVTGLALVPFPNRPSASEVKFFVLATTPRRIYQFIGTVAKGESPQFAELFSHYDTVKVQFLEIPGNLKGQLHLWPSQPSETPQAFAWLTGAGIYYGTLGFGDHEPGESLFLERDIIPFPHSSSSAEVAALPIGMCLTQFHCLLLYRDRVEAVCILNQKRVFEDTFNVRRDGPLFAMVMDPTSGCILAHQKQRIWDYAPHRESRNVWKIYLEQQQFELAKKYAEANRAHLDTILIQQAEHYFLQQRYQDAAVTFSQSQLSFEEVTLKFIQVNRKDALMTFLQRKLDSLGAKDSTQQTMLTTWLVELFLNDMGALKDQGELAKHDRLRADFHTFLRRDSLVDCLDANKKTIYELISSHGAVDDVVFFAMLMKDYERVIGHHISRYNYEEALKVLTDKAAEVLQAPEKERRGRFKRFTVLFYKFSPALFQHCPRPTVEAWVRMGSFLTPRKLVPALVQCSQQADHKQVAAMIRYLEFCVSDLQSKDKTVHNFLIAVYAKSTAAEHHRRLLDYLVEQGKGPVVYDMQYALRVCSESKLEEACVHIYAAMGLFQESVELALKVDVELARRIAATPLRSKDVQKKLWLTIAKHVIKREDDIGRAMQFLQECSLLKIEDILPFFPDFVTIEHFKDAICQSLAEYNAHIDDLKQEMQAATDSAENIRADITDIRNKCVFVDAETCCEICDSRLLTQGFFMFPCRHAFHRDCLITRAKKDLLPKERAELEQLLSRPAGAAESTGGKDDVRVKIDSIVGSECLYCGDKMIRSIQEPFIPPDQFAAALDSWK